MIQINSLKINLIKKGMLIDKLFYTNPSMINKLDFNINNFKLNSVKQTIFQ